MIRIVRTTLALLLVAGGLSVQLGTPSPVRAASGGWKACAARPVPLPPARPVDPALTEVIQKRVVNWQQARRTKYAGLSAAIRWDDGREVSAVSGSADRNSGRAVDTHTPFALASVSKPFTAAIALLLDACGLMPLTTRASSLVPYADVRAEATIADLLRHEAGMTDWLTDKYTRMDWLISHPNGKVGPKTAVQNLLARGEIGTFDYSNSSLTLVTLAAERATGVPWKTLMSELLLKPLGLKETGFGPVVGAARTHTWSRGALRPFGQPGWGPTRSVAAVLRGAGDLFSTPHDLVRFGELLWGDRLLEGSQTQLINGIANLTGRPWSYTIGTMMDRSWLGGLRTYGHTGGYSGVSTTLRRIPELGVTIAVTANGMGTPGGYADDLAINLIDLIDVAAPSTAQMIAGVSGAGLTAAARANPEPFPAEAAPTYDVCGDPSASRSGERWIDLASGASGDWSGAVTSMAQLPNGTLLVAGQGVTRAGGSAVKGIAQRSPVTGTWRPFVTLLRSNGSVADLYSMQVDRRRMRLYIAGDFTRVGTGSRQVRALGIAQLNLMNGKWSALGPGIQGADPLVRAIALDEVSGTLAIVGRFSRAGNLRTKNVATWQAERGWAALNPPSDAELRGLGEAVAISPNGAVSISGNLSIRDSGAYIARWTAVTAEWRAIATSATMGSAPHLLATDQSGMLIAATGISWYGATPLRESILSGYGWERLDSGLSLPRRGTWISALTSSPRHEVLIGGAFTQSGGRETTRIAAWSPARLTLEPLGLGLSSEPDALAASETVRAYAATRLRGEPGTLGRRCITAWGLPAALSSPTPRVTPRRKALDVRWEGVSTPGVSGWIATARTASGGTSQCMALSGETSCSITGLTPGTKYRVTLRSYSVPAGPSPESTKVTATTSR